MTLIDALKVNGKARLSQWNAAGYIYFRDSKWCRGAFFNQDGIEYVVSPMDFLSEDWQPYKGPCKHEPYDRDHVIFKCEFVRVEHAFELMNKCKHCGIKIKAEKWVDDV